MTAHDEQTHHAAHRCPACEWQAWISELRSTALWLRLTTPPALLQQLTEKK